MPTYNVELYIADAIKSVLAQNYKNWELLVINDGSTDASGAIASDFAKKDTRIRVYHKNNGGLSDARNYGLEKARGEFVHFFDSDDTIDAHFYETLIRVALENEVDFVICGYVKEIEKVSQECEKIEIHAESLNTPLPSGRSYRDLFESCFNYAWNKLFKTSFLKVHGLRYQKGLSVIEDKEFMSRVVAHNPRFCFVDYCGYNYQVRQRETLGNSYRDNLLSLHLEGLALQYGILERYCKIEDILNQDKSRSFGTCVMWVLHCMFTSKNLNAKEKYQELSKMVHHDVLKEYLHSIRCHSFVERLICNLILRKKVALLYVLCQLKEMTR